MNKKLEKELGRVNEELARSEKHIKEAQEHHKTLLEKKTQIENDIIIDRIRDMQGKAENSHRNAERKPDFALQNRGG